MKITATKIYLPEHPWEPTRTGLGIDAQGRVVTFTGTSSWMEGVRAQIAEQGETEVEIAEFWQILAILPANAQEPDPKGEATARVAEFVRQWEMRKDRADYSDEVYSVHFDPKADEGATLTIADIKTLLEG